MLKAECYFALHRMTNVEKLKTTIISFEGEALVWFKYENRRRQFLNWVEIRSQMICRFRPSPESSMYEEFLSIKQEGSVREYK